MPTDKFFEYKRYLEAFKNTKRKTDDIPLTYTEWLRSSVNELSDSGRNLELATALASGDGSEMLDVRRAGLDVMHEYAHHSAAFLSALARTRVARMTRMISYCDQVEDNIMQEMEEEDPSKPIDLKDKINYYRLLQQAIETNRNLIETVLDYSRGTPVDPNKPDVVQYGDRVGNDSYQDILADKHDRSQLRDAVQLLIKGVTPRLLDQTAEPNGKAKKRK